MSVSASIRAHANLNLFLAERAIAGLEAGNFTEFLGEHADLFAIDAAVFRLQLAYRCHLADLCEQKQLTLRPRSAAEASVLIGERDEFVPEILELAEKEETVPWLGQLLAVDFLPTAVVGSSGDNADVIVRSTDEGSSIRNPQALSRIVTELKELFARHRDTQQEY